MIYFSCRWLLLPVLFDIFILTCFIEEYLSWMLMYVGICVRIKLIFYLIKLTQTQFFNLTYILKNVWEKPGYWLLNLRTLQVSIQKSDVFVTPINIWSFYDLEVFKCLWKVFRCTGNTQANILLNQFNANSAICYIIYL